VGVCAYVHAYNMYMPGEGGTLYTYTYVCIYMNAYVYT